MGHRIVLTTHGSLGDLHPYLAIALGLKARGHHPIIVTSEYHRRTIAAADLEFHAIRPDITFTDKERHRRLNEPKRGLEREVREVIFDNGARVERLGAGRILLRKHYQADRVAVELRQMLENPKYQTNATVIGQQMQQADGVGTACDAIEKQLLPQSELGT